MRVRVRDVVCAFAAVTAGASAALAQSAQPPLGRFAVSATLGVSRPVDAGLSEVYGGGLVPVTAQLEVRLEPAIALFGGVRFLKADGQTVVVGTKVAEETYGTSFRMTSVRLGAQVAARIAPGWALAGGAGVSLVSYEETWPDAGLRVTDRATGLLALAEGRYAVNRRWNVLARVEYTTIPETSAVTGSHVNLGGLDVSAGVRLAF